MKISNKTNGAETVTVGSDKKVVIKVGWRLTHFITKNSLESHSQTTIKDWYREAVSELGRTVAMQGEVSKVVKRHKLVDLGEGEYQVNDEYSVTYDHGETADYSTAAELCAAHAAKHTTKANDYSAAGRKYAEKAAPKAVTVAA